jgi:hypothetical protein
MGKLTWNGWVTSWDQIRKAPQATSIIMGKNLVRNAPPASKPSDIAAIASDESDLDDITSIQGDADVLEDASETRHFEISFPISPSKATSERDSSGE